MSQISNYPGDFYKDLGEWVRAFTQAEETKRRREQSLQNKQSSIRWYEQEISKLKPLVQRRPSTMRQINEYQRRIRQIELEIAFEVF